jgi:hypothetical protein
MIKTANPLGKMPATQKDARNCPSCGSFPGKAQPITDRYGWTWSLHTCYRCGVEYQARPMTELSRREFYASGRYRELCAAVTGKPWTDAAYLREAQREYARHWCRGDYMRWLPNQIQHGHWLDYGGSTGEVAIEWGKERIRDGDLDVTIADYGDGATVMPDEAFGVPPDTYDAVLCCQTLDHVPDPFDTLRGFLSVAKTGARLFVDVVKKAHTQYKIDHETYYPTAASFLGLVERSGWTVLWLDAETNPTHYSILAEKP